MFFLKRIMFYRYLNLDKKWSDLKRKQLIHARHVSCCTKLLVKL